MVNITLYGGRNSTLLTVSNVLNLIDNTPVNDAVVQCYIYNNFDDMAPTGATLPIVLPSIGNGGYQVAVHGVELEVGLPYRVQVYATVGGAELEIEKVIVAIQRES